MSRVSNKEFHCLHCNNCNTSRSTKILVRLILVNPFNNLWILRPHCNILPTARVCLFRILYTINRLCQLSMLFLLPLGKIYLQISNNMFRSLSRRCYHTRTYRQHGTPVWFSLFKIILPHHFNRCPITPVRNWLICRLWMKPIIKTNWSS